MLVSTKLLVDTCTLSPTKSAVAVDVGANTAPSSRRKSSRPGFPPGLEVGKRYEISVQLEVASGGELHGRSRTFFEFAPLPAGGSNVAVYLPSVGTDGKFKFDVEVKVKQPLE